MKTVLILGGTGMLGNAVGKYFQSLPGYDVWLTTRDMSLVYGSSNWISYDPTGRTGETSSLNDVFARMQKNPDLVINAVGTIKPFMDSDPEQAIFLNALLPHQLAKTCAAFGVKMIHITSDCVFAGKSGGYSESSLHDPLDAYGKSKSLGETKDCMVIRTSIIGEEIHKNASLVEWVKSQAGKSVNGFTNHYWNGITTKQFASACHQILEKNLYENGLFHVHSDTVCKVDLVEMINQKFNLGISINRIDTLEAVDRTMMTEKSLLSKLDVPSLAQQIQDM